MTEKRRVRLYFYGLTLFLLSLLGYRIFVIVVETDYVALNVDNMDSVKTRLATGHDYQFAVIGNIQNSMRLLEQKIAPLMSEKGSDFMVSVGNGVFNGAEGKYRLLYRGLKTLPIPYLITVGPNEIEDFGTSRFYNHFGPLFYTFVAGQDQFIFLDSTGATQWKWQIPWLKQTLSAQPNARYRFVFMSRAPVQWKNMGEETIEPQFSAKVIGQLQQLLQQYQVTAVFSGNGQTFEQQTVSGVLYAATGNGGGLMLGSDRRYQFVNVSVSDKDVVLRPISVPATDGAWQHKFENLKLYLHSFVYMSFFTWLVVLGIGGIVLLRLYVIIQKQQHLYRDFDFHPDGEDKEPLFVMMFSNNYLPYIGGVPISVHRLMHGLMSLGNHVRLIAPQYESESAPSDDDVIRVPALFYTTKERFPVTRSWNNVVASQFQADKVDIVHVHHLSGLGLLGLRLAKKHQKPLVFTYHTRLERYTHYIPGPGKVIKNAIAHMLVKRFANRCDAIITPSPSTEEYLRNLGVSALVEAIPTGINLDEYQRWSDTEIAEFRAHYVAPNDKLLISVSRLAKEKNMDFLVDGLIKAHALTGQKFTCLLVGDGPQYRHLKNKVAASGLSDSIRLFGKMEPQQIALAYLAADVFVFASTSETQGMVLLEAMAAGCPVVAVRASGVNDVVRHGENGITVSESTDHWSQALGALLDDPGRLRTMSQRARETAARFSSDKIAQEVDELYRRVIAIHAGKID